MSWMSLVYKKTFQVNVKLMLSDKEEPLNFEYYKENEEQYDTERGEIANRKPFPLALELAVKIYVEKNWSKLKKFNKIEHQWGINDITKDELLQFLHGCKQDFGETLIKHATEYLDTFDNN